MENFNLRAIRNLFLTAALSLAALPACGGGGASISASGEAFNRSSHALTFGAIYELDGSFGVSCLQRSGGWSVPIVPLTSQTNPSLDVVRDNVGCILTLDSLRIGPSESSATSFVADMPLSLSSAFASSAVAFRQTPTGPVSFYANARISPDASFSSNFTVEMIYADDPSLLGAAVTATYEVVSAVATVSGIPAPDYTIDVTGLSLQIDAANLVSATNGQVALMDNLQPGDTYVVSPVDLGPTPSYADIDSQYLAGTAVTIAGQNPIIMASDFNLTGADLSSPVVRNVIVARTAAGARSYQLVTITFYHP